MILGQKIENDPSIDRLIEIRTILEKIRPIDHKLRYQIDKLVKTAVTGSSSTSDPLTFKANPGNLMASMAGSSSNDTSDDDEIDNSYKKKKKSKELDPEADTGLYVPPKLTAMHYDDDTSKEKKEKLLQKQKLRAINSTLVDEWKEEFLDTPVEVSAGSRAQQMISRAQKEKEEYEEKYFTRIPLSKSDKHRQKHLSTVGKILHLRSLNK